MYDREARGLIMQVLVLGATGGVGRLVVEEALTRGHDVTVLVRNREKLGPLPTRVRAVQGDALDASAVSRASAGQDAVVYVLGSGNVRQTTLFSETTQIARPYSSAIRRLPLSRKNFNDHLAGLASIGLNPSSRESIRRIASQGDQRGQGALIIS
jgi:NAD(P)-dependent dehydrogenase (short-subunit alcohol dehydrogenase family)